MEHKTWKVVLDNNYGQQWHYDEEKHNSLTQVDRQQWL